MNWLRYVLLAVCILSALAGYRKGLVRTVLSMVSLILVTGLAIWMNPYVTDVLNERTTLPQYVEKKCLETFENNEFLSGENQDLRRTKRDFAGRGLARIGRNVDRHTGFSFADS